MEVKDWSYEEFPEFSEEVEGAAVLETTGEEPFVRYIPDVEYAQIDGVALHLQLLIPTTRNGLTGPLPCVAHVQGSAWMQQDVKFNLPQYAQLAARGYVVAVVQYRHSGIAAFPAQAIDTRNAIRFLRVHAAEFGIDPERMIVSGDSSGGHTAMFAGIRHNDEAIGDLYAGENLYPGVSAEVKGIVDFYGSVSVLREDSNPTTVNHHLPDSPEGMVMGGVDMRANPKLRKILTVESNITEETSIAPVLIFHGTKDRIVSTWQSVDLYRKLKAVGKDVTLYLVKGADHGGAEFWTEQIMDIVDAFIRRCLKG